MVFPMYLLYIVFCALQFSRSIDPIDSISFSDSDQPNTLHSYDNVDQNPPFLLRPVYLESARTSRPCFLCLSFFFKIQSRDFVEGWFRLSRFFTRPCFFFFPPRSVSYSIELCGFVEDEPRPRGSWLEPPDWLPPANKTK